MIQIDDAGWGSLLGGVFISGYRVGTGEYATAEIPVTSFQDDNFRNRAYEKEVEYATICILGILGLQDNEEIEICRGEILKPAREYIVSHGYKMSETKIEGALQAKVESELLRKIKEYGLKGITMETTTQKQGLFFYLSLQWLKGGNLNGKVLKEREKYAKTGWPTYKFWADLPYEYAKAEVKKYKENKKVA